MMKPDLERQRCDLVKNALTPGAPAVISLGNLTLLIRTPIAHAVVINPVSLLHSISSDNVWFLQLRGISLYCTNVA